MGQGKTFTKTVSTAELKPPRAQTPSTIDKFVETSQEYIDQPTGVNAQIYETVDSYFYPLLFSHGPYLRKRSHGDQHER